MNDTIRTLVMDEYPVNEDGGSINIYVYAGDEIATVVISDKHSSYDQDEEQERLDAEGDGERAEPITSIDTFWNEDDLYEMVMSCTQALAATGKTKLLANLVRDVANVLATEMGA